MYYYYSHLNIKKLMLSLNDVHVGTQLVYLSTKTWTLFYSASKFMLLIIITNILWHSIISHDNIVR